MLVNNINIHQMQGLPNWGMVMPQPEILSPSAFKGWGQGEGNDAIPRIMWRTASALSVAAPGSKECEKPS